MNPCIKCGGDAQRETDGERRWYECMDCHQKTVEYVSCSDAGDDWDRDNPLSPPTPTEQLAEIDRLLLGPQAEGEARDTLGTIKWLLSKGYRFPLRGGE